MDISTLKRQQLIEAINTLPEDSPPELSSFIAYLHYKSIVPKSEATQANFLLSVAGLGTSGEKDVSERDEAILVSEVDPLYGWSLHKAE